MSRRAFGGVALAGAGVALSACAHDPSARAASGLNFHTLTFFKLTEGTIAEWIKSEGEGHAPTFVALTERYLARYVKSFLLGAEMGHPGFDQISEYGYRTAADVQETLKLLDDPRARQTGYFDNGGRGDYPSVPVNEQILGGPARVYHAGGQAKRLMMLKRSPDMSQPTFEAAAAAFGKEVAGHLGDRAQRVALNIGFPSDAPPRTGLEGRGLADPSLSPADAFLFIWPSDPTDRTALPRPKQAGIRLTNVLELEEHTYALKV